METSIPNYSCFTHFIWTNEYFCIQCISVSKLVLTQIKQWGLNAVVKRQKHLNGHSSKQQMKYYIGISHCPSGPTGMYRRQVHAEYRPPLLHPLLLWYSEWIAALVVDVSNHLLPAVIWCFGNYQFIALWNQYKYGDPVGQFIRYSWNLNSKTFSPSALASAEHHPFPIQPEQVLLGLWVFLVSIYSVI